MALFGKKNTDRVEQGGAEAGEADNRSEPAGFSPNPTKAEPFFRHAQTMHDSSNYEYAVTLWLQGFRQDPTSLTGMESFVKSCEAFIAERGKFGSTKDQVKSFGGKGGLEKVLLALLQWGTKPLDCAVGVKVVEEMSKNDTIDWGEHMHWVGEKTLAIARHDNKRKKSTFIKLMDLFQTGGVYDLSVQAGEIAMEIDPADGPLQTTVRNLSAQATMTRGGYDQTGQAGGFRSNIRFSAKQQRLEEEGRIVKTEAVIDRIITDCKADYESRPDDTASVQKYTRALLERGTPADEKAAYEILIKAHKKSTEFRFRQQAGEIKIRQGRRKVARLKREADERPDDQAAQKLASRGARAILKLEMQEYQLRIDAYPTDLSLKFELGKRLFELGNYEDAIQLFQTAQNDPKRRALCLSYLGQAFLKLGWRDEAIDTLRSAIDSHEDKSDAMGKELRYGLMSALAIKGQDEQDLAAAEEAAKIASSIAVEQIDFQDIRNQRGKLQELVKEIRAATSS